MLARISRPFACLLVAGALGAGLAACGGEDPATAGAGTARPDDEAQLAFAKCMRAKGIDIPDPGAGGRPQRVRIPRNVSSAKLQSAMQTCRKETGGGPPEMSDEQRTEFRDAALKFAKCMRANGVNMPDPSTDGPGGGLLLRRGSGLNPDSPAFRRAMEKCQDELPLGGPGGPGRSGGAAVGGSTTRGSE